MNCPHCASASKEQSKKTSLGYQTFHCSVCHRIFNEPTFRTTIGQSVSLAGQRDLFRQRFNVFAALILSVW